MIENMTTREKIKKFVKASNPNGYGGDTLTISDQSLRINKQVTDLTDKECEQVASYLDLDMSILKLERQKEEARALARANRTNTIIRPEQKPCGCGCGELAKSGREFRPGHDMKLKARLRKAAKGGDKEALKTLKGRGWSV